MKTWFKNDAFFSSSEAKTRKNVPPAERLQRDPRGGGAGGPGVAAKPRPPVHWSVPVYWHMTQPVHTVLAKATRAQPYDLATQYQPQRTRGATHIVQTCTPECLQGNKKIKIRQKNNKRKMERKRETGTLGRGKRYPPGRKNNESTKGDGKLKQSKRDSQ